MAEQDLAELEKLLLGITNGLKPSARKKIAEKAATILRLRNAKRIQANTDPDGRAFVPRKRKPNGKIRARANMFKKLRQFRRLLKKATPDGLEVGFFRGADARIATVHQEGLVDKVDKKFTKTVRYPIRRLLGYTLADDAAIMDEVVKMVVL